MNTDICTCPKCGKEMQQGFVAELVLGLIVILSTMTVLLSTVAAQEKPVPQEKVGPDARAWHDAVARSIRYLKTQGQAENGSFSASSSPAVTALVLSAVLSTGQAGAGDPMVAKSLRYLQGFVQEDGGIYAPGSVHRNYETALGLLAFQKANKDGKYRTIVQRAEAYLRKLQWDDGEGEGPASTFYGGAGYGSHSRPDLSNTQILLDALKEIDLPPDDPAMQRALIFVSRCQNLESEHNTLPFAALVNDGGFYYTPAAGGTSQAGKNANGGLRSYGSMTYAGLKSMIYAGVGPEDPRVKAAFQWIQKHYTVEANPGMGADGLYYYYHTFAKALAALKLDFVEDAEGRKHDWRRELAEELVRQQRPDGSWVNPQSKRWYEGDPNLVSAYALLALSYCKPQTP